MLEIYCYTLDLKIYKSTIIEDFQKATRHYSSLWDCKSQAKNIFNGGNVWLCKLLDSMFWVSNYFYGLSTLTAAPSSTQSIFLTSLHQGLFADSIINGIAAILRYLCPSKNSPNFIIAICNITLVINNKPD